MSVSWTIALDNGYQQLRSALQTGLASVENLAARRAARAAFSPGLSYGRHFGPPAPSARQAAVIAMIEPRGGQWTLPVTVRPDHLPDHPGQISLPGGRLEAGESHQRAAEREFCEELGCQVDAELIVGELSPLYVYHSDYYVRSFVAISPRLYDYRPCPREVSRVLHVPLATLSSCVGVPAERQEFARGLAVWSAPTIQGGEATIWGATAIILAELSAILPANWPQAANNGP